MIGTEPVLVDTDDRQVAHIVDVEHLSTLLAATLGELYSVRPAEVGLALVSVEEMTELNQNYMGASGPTDVLAFPIDGVLDPAAVPQGQPTMLGDIVICPEYAAHAPQPLSDELALLVVHGALHLLGHDHAEPEETALMKSLEAALLDRHHRGRRTIQGRS